MPSPSTITITPPVPAAGTPYHVAVCGLQQSREVVIDTTGPGSFGERITVPVGDDRCAYYDAVAPPLPGVYAITVQQFHPHGPDVQPGAVKDVVTFTVQ